MMENININIPDIRFERDFSIIYKGKEEEIIEVKTSRAEILRKLRYFQPKMNEIKYMNEYYIHDEFHANIFKQFIESIENHQINLNDNNYQEIYKLSKKYEYHELSDSIEDFIEKRPDLQNIIEQLSNNINNDNEIELIDYDKEKIISKHLDFCLEHGNLSRLSIESLIRILNSPNRVIHNHHLLFKFVKEKLNENKCLNDDENYSMNLCILINSLDYNEMSTEEIIELMQYYDQNKNLNNFNQCHSNEFIKTIIEQIKQKEIEIDNIKTELTNQKQCQQEQHAEISKLLSLFTELETKFDQENQNLHENIVKQTQVIEEQRSQQLKLTTLVKSLEDKYLQEVEENKKIFNKLTKQEQLQEEQRIEYSKLESRVKILEEKYEQVVEENKKIRNDLSKYDLCANISSNETRMNEFHTISEKKQKKINKQTDEIENQTKKELIDSNHQHQNNKTNDQNSSSIYKIDFSGDELNGIISHLKKNNGDDLNKIGIIKLSSGHPPFQGSVENLIKYDANRINDCFHNHDGSNFNKEEGWIEFDFVDKKINLTSYTIRTSWCEKNGPYHPKTWRIIGSNDRNKWDILNLQTNNSSLNGVYFQSRFECKRNQNYYRYIRYIQDDSWMNDRKYCILLTCIEFFGSIKTK